MARPNYRKRRAVGDDAWHFCTNCPDYPTTGFDMRTAAGDPLCDNCQQLEASPMVQRIRYVGLDVSKERSAVALAEADGSVTEYGNIANNSSAVRRLVETRYQRMTVAAL